jgi:cytoskeleton protein RodZ
MGLGHLMADRLTGDFGGSLREARERRGVSLRQIANATKIGMSALEALERNDISRLPGGIFSRAFVRSYAIHVGLDPETTIQQFIAQFPQDSVTAGHPTSTQSEDHQAIDSDRRAATTFVRLIAISLPVAGALLYFGTTGRGAPLHAPRAQPSATAAIPVEAPHPAPVERPHPALIGTPPHPAPVETPHPVLGEAPPAAPVETLPAPVHAPLAVPAIAPAGSVATLSSDLLTVALSATGQCWVSATVDDEKTIERLLQPGEQLAMEVHRELVLKAGDPSALAITLNGAEAKPLGKAGQVVTARLNLTNFKDYVANR